MESEACDPVAVPGLAGSVRPGVAMALAHRLLVVLGPTGAGKTRLALRLARHFDGEVISADSAQVYRGFNIGTDKISEEEREGVPHHLLDILDEPVQFHAGDFLRLAHEAALDIRKRGRLPIVCGGTPLYLRALMEGLFPEDERADKRLIREHMRRECEERGVAALWAELVQVDPDYAEKIGPNDVRRILRGLEIFRHHGIRPSELHTLNRTPFEGWDRLVLGLDLGRETLYRRINERVSHMMDRGLIEEVQGLRAAFPGGHPGLGALGYRELVRFLDGACDLETTVALIQQHTRNYAKRQLTWFRRESWVEWVPADAWGPILERVQSWMNREGVIGTD